MGLRRPTHVLAAMVIIVVLYQLVPFTTGNNVVSYTYLATGYTCTWYPYYYTYCDSWWYYPYWNYYYSNYRYWSWGGYGWYYYPWFWGYRSYCYTAVGYNSYCNSYTYNAVAYKCALGWTSYPSCDVPICTQPCISGQTCTAPDTCKCVASRDNSCTNVACNAALNCYPGTCISNTYCQCPPGFAGANCDVVTLLPDISTCGAILFASTAGQPQYAAGTATECAALGLNETDWGTTWVGLGSSSLNADGSVGPLPYTQLQVTWQANYLNPFVMPDNKAATFVSNAPTPLGVVASSYFVTFPGTTITSRHVPCQFTNVAPSILQCNSVTEAFSDLSASSVVKHNSTMLIQIQAALGGSKIGISSLYFDQKFTGNSTTRSIKFQFDFKPPTHCAFTQTCTNGSLYPIYLNQTLITVNNKIQPTFNAWTDDSSGISKFHVDMYYLQPDINGNLDSVGGPISSTDVDITLNNFIFNCPQGGTYSIVLTVYDRAGNSAKVRKIFTYNDQPSIFVTSAPMYIDAADPGTGYQFITNLAVPQGVADYQFLAKWPGRYNSTFKSDWLRQVNRWPLQANAHDDIDGGKYGIRSTDPLTNMTGVLTYEFAYTVDSVGGIGAQEPSNFTSLNNTNAAQYSFAVPQSLLSVDGKTITMWLKAYDFNGILFRTNSKVSVQRNNDLNVTNPRVVFSFNDSSHTGVQLDVRSKIGGVKNITYSVYDKTLGTWISNAQNLNATVITRDPPATKRRKRDYNSCSPGDTTCYCIPLGMCYSVTQVIVIDNCVIDQFSNDALEVHYTIFTLSGYTVSSIVTITAAGNSIACRKFNLSGGAIFGILIAVVIFLILLILLILMFWRWKHDKHPVPARFRSMVTQFQNRSAAPHTTENEIYTSEIVVEKEKNAKSRQLNNPRKPTFLPPNKKNFNDDTKPDNTKSDVVTGKNVQIGIVQLGEGRFAIIKRADLLRGNQKIVVAVKALRSGCTRDDENIMKQKIQCMSAIPKHDNLVNYLATYEDHNGSAPAMLLEHCDQPLQDWLKSIKHVTPDVLDNMLKYSLDIARGMDHLTNNGITHKRLSAKNVLLVDTVNGTNAKLIGYGPTKDDQPSSGDKPIVKFKYLAPETLKSLKAVHPIYDEKTDAWSYGVTMWEIYSKGESPYANVKGSEVLKHLTSDNKLECPEDCAEELYKSTMLPCWNLKKKKVPTATLR